MKVSVIKARVSFIISSNLIVSPYMKKRLSVLVLIAMVVLPGTGTGQTSNSKQMMSPQFKEHARRAFHALDALDSDDAHIQTHHAHQLVNGLLDYAKTQTDQEVHNILFTWLAEIELARSAEPSAYRQWMKAEVDCQIEAEFFFGGLTEDGKKNAAQKIANGICFC